MPDRARRSAFALLAALGLSGPCHGGESAPRLTGIVLAGDLRLAIFVDPAGKGTLTVREGDRVGAYNVVRINAREVGLEGAGQRLLVQPGIDPAIRAELAPVLSSAPLIDPYRREKETENDQ